MLSTAQIPVPLASLIASLPPSLGTKPPSPSRGPSPRTRLTITACWTRAVVGTAAQWWEPMGKCYSAPPMCPEGQPLEAGEAGEGGSGQHPYGEGGSGSISCPWFTALCVLQSLPRCVQVSKRTPQPIMMGRGSGAHFINNIETQRPPTASTTLLVQRVLRDVLSFINLMMESKIILVHFFTCAQ